MYINLNLLDIEVRIICTNEDKFAKIYFFVLYLFVEENLCKSRSDFVELSNARPDGKLFWCPLAMIYSRVKF